MIRVTATFDTQSLESLIAFVDQFADVAYAAFEETVNEIEPVMLAELQDTPGTPKYPLRWASDKQRKFVMAKLRRDNNLPYRRTGKLAAGWQVSIERNGDTFAMVVSNPASVAKYVYGSLAQNRNAALRFQQPFHQDTGWQAATDTVSYWQQAVAEDYEKRLAKIARIQFERRAYTKGTRRTR